MHLPCVESELKEPKPPAAVLERMRAWCGMRDRSEREAEEKLKGLLAKMEPLPAATLRAQWACDWMDVLVQEGSLDDARCADSYVRVHLEHKSWGPLKIKAGLSARGVARIHIDRALAQFDEDRWQREADALVARRADELATRRPRVVRWLLGRGFPQRMVLNALDRTGQG